MCGKGRAGKSGIPQAYVLVRYTQLLKFSVTNNEQSQHVKLPTTNTKISRTESL